MYKTTNIVVKHEWKQLFRYCTESCRCAKAIKNATIFRCRQIVSADKKDFNNLHNNERQILDEFGLLEEKRLDKKLYIPNYYVFDKVFRKTGNPDYFNELAMQSTQQVVKEVLSDFKGYFAALREYVKHPEQFTDKPKLPHYVKSDGCSFNITNQDAVVRADKYGHRYLKLPKTKATVPLNDTCIDNIKEVIIQPFYDTYKISIVMEDVTIATSPDKCRIIGIDLGVNNFATVNNNCGLIPFIVNGKGLKSYNQWYNKEMSKLRSHIMKSNISKKRYTSKRIEKLNKDHYHHTTDFYNKAVSYIVKYCLRNDIGTIIVGKNNGWKQNINTGKQNNQTFCFIAHALFIKKLTLMAGRYGIDVIETEESYTSKASILDMDDMSKDTVFSGKRIKRGLYRTSDGICINADVNGAGNIIRKVFADAFSNLKDMSYMYKTINIIQIN